MRFQVPQFIEVEDKIFGPFTFKQFVYIAGGVGVCVLAFTFLPTFLAILVAVPAGALSAALAFYKYNSKPFIDLLQSFLNYSMKDKLYVWKKGESAGKPAASAVGSGEPRQVYIPKLSQSKLKDLSWSLDIKENTNPVTPAKPEIKDRL